MYKLLQEAREKGVEVIFLFSPPDFSKENKTVRIMAKMCVGSMTINEGKHYLSSLNK
jgi:hypothetical protein